MTGVDEMVAAAARQPGGTLMLRSDRLTPAELADEVLDAAGLIQADGDGISDPSDLEAIADEVEAGHGPVALVRPGHRPVVLVSADEWQRLDELESAESTAWWRRDATDRRAASGETPGDGEDEPGLDEDEFRRRFAHLFRSTGAA
jgi:PHD/YefM family antitoxin component YafN of YafNO toxin-antitoxin module